MIIVLNCRSGDIQKIYVKCKFCCHRHENESRLNKFCLGFLEKSVIRNCCLHCVGISFLPYPGAAYAAQVLDGSGVPTQPILPGVAYNAVVTTAIQSQSQYAQPVTSSYRLSDNSSTDKNATTVANTVPAPGNGQPLPLKQPLQSINLTDLLDYSFFMEHGTAEAAATVDLRNQTVLANMLQSLNAANLPAATCSDERNAQASQPVSIGQFPLAKQPAESQQLFQQGLTLEQQQHIALSNQQLTAGQLYGTVASAAALEQSSQQKGGVQSSGALWPWSDQVLMTDKTQAEGVVPSAAVATPVSSSSLPVSYEAVSPPSATVDNMTFSLLDNLQFTSDAASSYQLNSFLGSAVDTSTLFGAAPHSLVSISQQSRPDAWNSLAVTSASYSTTANTNARLQPVLQQNERSRLNAPLAALDTTTVSQQSIVELEKVQKQRPNLGVVLPMTHGNSDERNVITSQTSSSCRTTSVSGDVQSAVEQQNQSQYLPSSHLSAEKSAGSDTATGGIVLTNITGNVYVNQYTMLPGGAQPLDNTLLHADLAVGGAASSLPYDNVIDETTYSLAAPSVAVMLNNTNNELRTFAAEPLTSAASAQQPNNQSHSVQQTARKSVAPESSFFGADAAPVLAAKPSNKFESCFLQFICGHKAETLSSVLNSPIKTRPVLPKYIPEPRRPKVAEVPVNDSTDKTDKTEVLSEPALSEPASVTTSDTTATTATTAQSTVVPASVMNVC